MDILKGEIKIYSINDDEVYEVDFMNLVVDKADGLKVVDCDNHFCEFTGVHPSKIKQGKALSSQYNKADLQGRNYESALQEKFTLCLF